VFLGEAFGSVADKINMGTVSEDRLGSADGIADMLDATHTPRAQRGPVHHAGVKLHPAVHIEKGAAACVERLVVLHSHDRRFDGVEAASTALQDFIARGRRGTNTLKMGVNCIVRYRPGPAVDQHHRICRQERPSG